MIKSIVYISFCLGLVFAELDYGEFDLILKDYLLCKGPKRYSCVNGTVTRTGGHHLKFQFIFKEEVQGIRGKLIGILNKKELLRMQWNDVCENVLLKPFLEAEFGAKENCFIPKGTYQFAFDVQAASRAFFGGKFIFGNWTLKMVFYTNNCNMHCGTILYTLIPAKS